MRVREKEMNKRSARGIGERDLQREKERERKRKRDVEEITLKR